MDPGWSEMRHFLMMNEPVHSLPLGLAEHFTTHPESRIDLAYAGIIRDPGQKIVMTALRTEQHNLILSETNHPDAVDILIQDVQQGSARIPGVIGPRYLSQRFAEAWQKRTGDTVFLEMNERIHRLTKVLIDAQSLGAIRLARSHDRDWIIEWVQEFIHEATPLQSQGALRNAERSTAKLNLDPHAGGFFVLESNGTARCLVGYGNPTIKGIRVGPVYTPPLYRRRGYATELVRAVSQTLLDWGYREVYLFTDLKNPTSNRIYRTVGYEVVADVDSYAFSAMSS